MNRTVISALAALLISAGTVSAEEYIHYTLGKKYQEEGEYDLAKDELKKVVSMYPDHYNAYFMLGDIALTQGDRGSAEAYFQKALRYNPGWRSAARKLGKIYEDQGQYDKSIIMLQQALKSATGAERSTIEKDLNRVSGRKKSGAPATVKPKVTAKPKPSPVENVHVGPAPASARSELDKGVKSYRATVQSGKANFDVAVEHFRKALELHPGYPAAFYYSGMIRRRLGDDKAAKYNFERAVNDPEQGYNAHFYLAKIYGEERDYVNSIYHYKKYKEQTNYEPGRREAESMIQQYQKLLQKQAADTVNLAAVGQQEISEELSKLPQRFEVSEMQIRISPMLNMAIADTATAEGQAMLNAVKLFKAKRYDQAINAFRTVLEKYPRGKVAGLSLYDLGVCYMKLHDWNGAVDKFNQYRERFPQGNNVPNALFLQAVAYYEMKKNPTAKQLFQRYIQENRAGAMVGKAYEKLGDIARDEDQLRNADEAYDMASRSSSNTEDRIIALFKRGEVFAALKNWGMAVKQYETVIAEGEKSKAFVRVPDSYYRIADYLYREKKFTDAREKYLRVTRLYPTYQDTPWGLFQVGNIYKAQKQYQKAIGSYDAVINKFPEDYWATQAEWKKKDAAWQLRYGSGK